MWAVRYVEVTSKDPSVEGKNGEMKASTTLEASCWKSPPFQDASKSKTLAPADAAEYSGARPWRRCWNVCTATGETFGQWRAQAAAGRRRRSAAAGPQAEDGSTRMLPRVRFAGAVRMG